MEIFVGYKKIVKFTLYVFEKRLNKRGHAAVVGAKDHQMAHKYLC